VKVTSNCNALLFKVTSPALAIVDKVWLLASCIASWWTQ